MKQCKQFVITLCNRLKLGSLIGSPVPPFDSNLAAFFCLKAASYHYRYQPISFPEEGETFHSLKCVVHIQHYVYCFIFLFETMDVYQTLALGLGAPFSDEHIYLLYVCHYISETYYPMKHHVVSSLVF